MSPSPLSTLARTGITIIVVGFVVFLLGVFPELIRLSITPGVGLLQISVFLAGLTLMTLGAYIYAYATRHRAQPVHLREDIGVRLMATGVITTYATGFADFLAIGSHFGVERPLLGPFQAAGIALGVVLIIAGLGLYLQPRAKM